jgi:hypothetical protein
VGELKGGGMSRRDPVTVAQYEVLGRLGYGGQSRRDDRTTFIVQDGWPPTTFHVIPSASHFQHGVQNQLPPRKLRPASIVPPGRGRS